MDKGEFELIGDIRKRFVPGNKHILGIGDDTAIIDHNLLVTTDAMVDGVHFLSSAADLDDIAYKSMMVNISDLAAMGGYPLYALVTVGLPRGLNDERVQALLDGFDAARMNYEFDIIGGDTVKSETLFLSVTFVGLPFDYPLKRSGAKVKDFIYVTGRVGDSGIGLGLIQDNLRYPVEDKPYFLRRHYAPEPRVRLMEYLIRHHKIHACIDISDGFLGDLEHIAEESDCGYFIEMDELPLSKNKIGASFDRDPHYFFQLALSSGEDYELIFTTPEEIDTMKVYDETGEFITPVGFIEKNDKVVQYNGQSLDLTKLTKSFTHF